MLVHKMRILRIKYRITLAELAQGIGRSGSWLSLLELSGTTPTEQTRKAVARAFEEVVASRRSALYALEHDFLLHKNSLFEQAKEGDAL